MPITNVYAVKGGQGATTVAAAMALVVPDDGQQVRLIAPTVDELNDMCATLGLPPRQDPVAWERHPVSGRLTLEFNPWWYDDDTTDTVIVSSNGHVDLLGVTNLLVTRPCYLALRRAAVFNGAPKPDGVIVIREPGRSLTSRDIANIVNAPIEAEIAYDPAVAHAVDAGLLAARVPQHLRDALIPLFTPQEVQ